MTREESGAKSLSIKEKGTFLYKTIGVIGSRKRDSYVDFLIVEKAFLDVYQKGDRICSGKCPKGGDRFAVIIAERYEVPTLWFPPDWEKYGKRAAFIRNTDIARESDVLIACIADTSGTTDAIEKWKKFHPGESVILV